MSTSVPPPDGSAQSRAVRRKLLAAGLVGALLGAGGVAGVWAWSHGMTPNSVKVGKDGLDLQMVSAGRSPSLTLKCPPPGISEASSYPVVFDGVAGVPTAALPATLTIEYGDGKHYSTNTPAYFNSAYRHTCLQRGDFTVRVRLTDAEGLPIERTCAWSWH